MPEGAAPRTGQQVQIVNQPAVAGLLRPQGHGRVDRRLQASNHAAVRGQVDARDSVQQALEQTTRCQRAQDAEGHAERGEEEAAVVRR